MILANIDEDLQVVSPIPLDEKLLLFQSETKLSILS